LKISSAQLQKILGKSPNKYPIKFTMKPTVISTLDMMQGVLPVNTYKLMAFDSKGLVFEVLTHGEKNLKKAKLMLGATGYKVRTFRFVEEEVDD